MIHPNWSSAGPFAGAALPVLGDTACYPREIVVSEFEHSADLHIDKGPVLALGAKLGHDLQNATLRSPC